MILEQFKLNGKVAIVTGARTGLGQGMACGLAEAGADIVGIDLNNLFETQKRIEDLGRKFLGIEADLSRVKSVEDAVNRVPSYTASKSGVMGLTRLLACEWAPHRINVNAIAPGYMATDNTAPLRADPKRSREVLDRIPAGRWGAPDDLKGVAVFLASEASSYMNGFTIAVDGGWLAR
jgi:NAD(P)-dependent dehydrogenase (short-subunit alcohol dehydrogenase family)